MKIISVSFLLLHCLIVQATYGQSKYCLFISKNETALPDSIRMKLEKEFTNPEFMTNPNETFIRYVKSKYAPRKGQQYSFYILERGHLITKHTVANQDNQQRVQLASLASRGSALEFYNLSDFEYFFSDTLVVIDTLCLDFSKLNELSNECIRIVVNGKTFLHKDDAPILLTSTGLELQSGNYFAAELYCEINPHKKYSSTLFFLGPQEKEELKEFVNTIAAAETKDNLNEIIPQVQSFISLRWGKCQTEDIHHWFRQN